LPNERKDEMRWETEMRAWIVATSLLAALGGCNYAGTEQDQQNSQSVQPAGDPLASRDGREDPNLIPDAEARPIMQAQVVLDRLGFTPGVVDGKEGMSTRNAVSGFQEANGLPVTGELDEATRSALAKWNTIPATRVVTIPDQLAAGPFQQLPDDPAEQAKLSAMGYESLDEKLAERFHTTIETLQMLNPGGKPATRRTATATKASAAAGQTGPTPMATPSPTPSPTGGDGTQPPTSMFRAGQQIRVPNVGADAVDGTAVSDPEWRNTLTMLGVGSEQPQAARVVVSKSKGTLKAYDADDKLIAVYTATMGSENDPLPLGEWKVVGIARNPDFTYNPDLFWDADPSDEKAVLPPGPNNPVGVVWIDISKEHYGIHGTPSPATIGRAESHGCVRLTNWDAARLAQMVSTRTALLFEA
jgi:lipoprotein-anchoring transpeptidase ErfK/SrfK